MLQERWWLVIEAMADYVACGIDYDDLEDEWVQEALIDQGFSPQEIDTAIEWLEMASISGSVPDIFSMLQPKANGMRVPSPLEKICISERIWGHLDQMRNLGIISYDLTERLLEGIRTIDTRDWEEEEVNDFLKDILATSIPGVSDRILRQLCSKNIDLTEFYS